MYAISVIIYRKWETISEFLYASRWRLYFVEKTIDLSPQKLSNDYASKENADIDLEGICVFVYALSYICSSSDYVVIPIEAGESSSARVASSRTRSHVHTDYVLLLFGYLLLKPFYSNFRSLNG